MKTFDVIIVGAGAAGLMCAIEAGKRGRKVLVLEKANKPGKKILMSGGGRCNFTNYDVTPDKYISHNPHFVKSALNRFTQWDFIALVEKHGIPFHEKTLGQLFCDHKSQAILNLLLTECNEVGVTIQLNNNIEKLTKLNDGKFLVISNQASLLCQSLVIASGGLSIPTLGASPFGYQIAEQFGIPIWPIRAGLVPILFTPKQREQFSILSGISVRSLVSHKNISFCENILFTHRGLSGPAILQISSYCELFDNIKINLLPEIDVLSMLKSEKVNQSEKQLKSILSIHLPKRLVEIFFNEYLLKKQIKSLLQEEIIEISQRLNNWTITVSETEGYRTAEVTLGGVDCNSISSKTMEVSSTPGLFFIGEVLDVTGWLGGYNFQWAWSSGWAAGQVV